MYYFGGGGFLILVSILLSLKGFWILFKFKKYWYIIGHSIILLGFPTLFFYYVEYIQNMQNDDIKLWLFIPVAILIPVWLIWGFFVNSSADKIKDRENKPFST